MPLPLHFEQLREIRSKRKAIESLQQNSSAEADGRDKAERDIQYYKTLIRHEVDSFQSEFHEKVAVSASLTGQLLCRVQRWVAAPQELERDTIRDGAVTLANKSKPNASLMQFTADSTMDALTEAHSSPAVAKLYEGSMNSEEERELRHIATKVREGLRLHTPC